MLQPSSPFLSLFSSQMPQGFGSSSLQPRAGVRGRGHGDRKHAREDRRVIAQESTWLEVAARSLTRWTG